MPAMSPAERLTQGWRTLLSRLHPRRDVLVVRLKGELGADTAKSTTSVLRAALLDAPKVLEVDLSGVTHLSPDGTPPLFFAAHGARVQGIRFSVTHAPAQAQAILRQVGLERYLADAPAP